MMILPTASVALCVNDPGPAFCAGIQPFDDVPLFEAGHFWSFRGCFLSEYCIFCYTFLCIMILLQMVWFDVYGYDKID